MSNIKLITGQLIEPPRFNQAKRRTVWLKLRLRYGLVTEVRHTGWMAGAVEEMIEEYGCLLGALFTCDVRMPLSGRIEPKMLAYDIVLESDYDDLDDYYSDVDEDDDDAVQPHRCLH